LYLALSFLRLSTFKSAGFLATFSPIFSCIATSSAMFFSLLFLHCSGSSVFSLLFFHAGSSVFFSMLFLHIGASSSLDTVDSVIVIMDRDSVIWSSSAEVMPPAKALSLSTALSSV
jgi:hypothetical protein